MPMPEGEPASPSVSSPHMISSSRAADRASKRVLACILCQQRKVKCDRKFPCANCTKAGAQCVPAALTPRQRRRRFPERELLDRLRHYEDLLRQNNIDFEPLHASSATDRPPSETTPRSRESPAGDASPRERRERRHSPSYRKGTDYETKNFWRAMKGKSQKPGEDDESDDDGYHSGSSFDGVRESVISKAMDQAFENDSERLLFGSPKPEISISTLHPEQIQVFRLWQIYIERVDPLLKVTHNPTLQVRIIDAAGDMANINPVLEALMFSIYCTAVMSLAEDECQTLFKSAKRDLVTGYRLGCQQALQNAGYLKTVDRDCLTAFFLYLISVGPDADPRSLSPISGLAVRIAQRMGISAEYSYIKCSPLEAEMRRRLWWALVIFDTRIGEKSAYKTLILDPTWDCKPPLNVNDFDLRSEMKMPPEVHSASTESLFAVVRSEMSDFIRHCAFFLDFINPALKSVARDVQDGPIPEGGELVLLEKRIEEKYLKFCDPENALHYQTLWTARGYLAKNQLLEHYSKNPGAQTDAQRDSALLLALTMLRCDAMLMGSPLVKRYYWFNLHQFPFPAYVHVIQDLRKRPTCKLAKRCWEVMEENYRVRYIEVGHRDSPFLQIFAKSMLAGWKARETALQQMHEPEEPPPTMITSIKERLDEMTPRTQEHFMGQMDSPVEMNLDDFTMPMTPDFATEGLMSVLGGNPVTSGPQGPALFPGMHPHHPLNVAQFSWPAWGWHARQRQGW